MVLNLPNILTISRIVAVPGLVALFYWEHPLAGWVSCAVFTVAAITDFFDGYLARSMRQISRFGRMLDPIADKLLVGAVVLMLVAFDRAPVLAGLVILCRELLVSGLREFLAEIRAGMPVSRLAKWKTAIQMVAIGFLLVGPAGPVFFHPAATTQTVGEVLLWIAAALTLVTGFDYLRTGLRHVEDPPPAKDAARPQASGPS